MAFGLSLGDIFAGSLGTNIGATAVALPAIPIYEQHKARKLAEEQAALERERLAALASEKQRALPDEESIRRARRRGLIDLMRRRGRASTILTGDTAGADASSLATDTLGA